MTIAVKVSLIWHRQLHYLHPQPNHIANTIFAKHLHFERSAPHASVFAEAQPQKIAIPNRSVQKINNRCAFVHRGSDVTMERVKLNYLFVCIDKPTIHAKREIPPRTRHQSNEVCLVSNTSNDIYLDSAAVCVYLYDMVDISL